jgi:hypothetical protein
MAIDVYNVNSPLLYTFYHRIGLNTIPFRKQMPGRLSALILTPAQIVYWVATASTRPAASAAD